MKKSKNFSQFFFSCGSFCFDQLQKLHSEYEFGSRLKNNAAVEKKLLLMTVKDNEIMLQLNSRHSTECGVVAAFIHLNLISMQLKFSNEL